ARDDLGTGVGERLARRARAGGQVEHPLTGQRRHGADDLAAPAPVLAEGQDVVGDVVALGDGVEHPPDVGRLLVEVCAGHAPERRASPGTTAAQAPARTAPRVATTKCTDFASEGP